MSRTDRHRPYWVQQADPYEQDFHWFNEGITWGWRKAFNYRDCCCKHWWCWMGGQYKRERRAQRHADQRRLREALKGDTEAFDQR